MKNATIRFLLSRLNYYQKLLDGGADVIMPYVVIRLICDVLFMGGYCICFDDLSRKWSVCK